MIKSDKNGCSKFLSSYISGIATFLEKNIYSWRCWEKRSCQLKTNTYWFWFQNGLRKKNWLRFCFSRGWKKLYYKTFNISFLNLYCKISYPFVIRKFDMVIQKPLENKKIIVKNNQNNNKWIWNWLSKSFSEFKLFRLKP